MVFSFSSSINTSSRMRNVIASPSVLSTFLTIVRKNSQFLLKMANLTRSLILLAAICIVLFEHTTNGQKYSNKYDEIDIDEVLSNSRSRSQYVRCLLNTSPCVSGAARFLKDKFAEAFVTKCNRCTDKQVIFFEKITEWFTSNDPETWNQLVRSALQKIQRKSK